ncbi:transcriptional regulator [Colwellia sp. Bg11-28]|nr:transcriptional regulator [Colwellia sp. Bg11-28]
MFSRIENGNIITHKRKELGKTQKALSEETGVHKSIISLIENGKFTGSLRVYERYINGLGLELSVSPIRNRIPDFDDLQDFFKDD